MTPARILRPGMATAVLLVLLLATVVAVAAPSAEEIEKWKKYQNQLLARGEKDKLLAEFRDRVAKSETAAVADEHDGGAVFAWNTRGDVVHHTHRGIR